MKRLALTLLTLALIILLLGKSASRLAESITLCSIGLALVLVERILVAIRRRVSSGVGFVACIRLFSACRQHRVQDAKPACAVGCATVQPWRCHVLTRAQWCSIMLRRTSRPGGGRWCISVARRCTRCCWRTMPAPISA